jgi:hypothetical protein
MDASTEQQPFAEVVVKWLLCLPRLCWPPLRPRDALIIQVVARHTPLAQHSTRPLQAAPVAAAQRRLPQL